MMMIPGRGGRAAPRLLLALALGSALMAGLAACGGNDEPPAAVVPPPVVATPAVATLAVNTLSGRPDMVSGGDALVEVAVPAGIVAADVRLALAGADVTSVFTASSDGRKLRGLVAGLAPGNNKLVAQVEGNKAYGELVLNNHPITGPVFSGTQLSPFECRTIDSSLGAALDASCSVAKTYDWFYFDTTGTRKVLAAPLGPRPSDMGTTVTLSGKTVSFIVRVESGTINRSIYRIAVLDDPLVAGQWNSANWNGRVVFRFGESTAAQYNQGSNSFSDVFKTDTTDKQSVTAMGQGFAYVISTLNINKVNVNDVVAAETSMMIREHITKHYGVPRWMLGMGGSGGAIQQMLIAQNYPGILDGIMPDAVFADVFSTALAVSDCRLLNTYFTNSASPGYPFSDAVRKSVEGHLKGTCNSWSVGNGDAVLATSGSVSPACGLIDTTKVYNPVTNPTGARCTVYDINVNTLGKDPFTGAARRPLDNVGIQYGLAGLKAGTLSKTQFLDLNERVGGYDSDGNINARRTVADPAGLKNAYEMGRIGAGGGGLATVPIFSIHPYAEPGADIHTIYNDLKVRAQLERTSGRSDNQVIWLYPNPALAPLVGKPLQVAPLTTLLASTIVQRFTLMTQWLDGITGDSAPLTADKVVQYKPGDATDSCWDVNDSQRYKEAATYNGAGMCNTLYPKTPPPRMVAGGPLADDVVKCQLKPAADADYAPVVFTTPEKVRLASIFPDGVCDYSKTGVGQAKLKGTWLTY
ncbi:DUF6351 family protein [soil metagenome]